MWGSAEGPRPRPPGFVGTRGVREVSHRLTGAGDVRVVQPQVFSPSAGSAAGLWSVISWYEAVSVQGPRVLGTVMVLRLARITGYQRPRIRTASPGWMVAWLCPATAPVVICCSRMPSQ